MLYTIRHVTSFAYDRPITESVMEARVQPRSDGVQRLVQFSLTTSPTAQVLAYQDFDGNTVHHFDIPGHHDRLVITADAMVECGAVPDTPLWLDRDAWERLDAVAARGDLYDWLAPSRFARPSATLDRFAEAIRLQRGPDPLSALRRLTEIGRAHV